jgi:Domain of unknown function (DUF4153)
MSILSSFQTWLSEALQNLRKYTLTLLVSLLATVIFVYVDDNIEKQFDLYKIGMMSVASIPLFFGIEMYTQNRGKNKVLFLGLGIVVVLLVYFFQFPANFLDFEKKNTFIRFVLIQAIFVLFAAVFPFYFSKNTKDFWFYNKSVFLAILTAVIYTFTLTLGLLLALTAIEKLFGVHMKGNYYKNVWVVCNMFVNTFIFLSRIPSKEEIENDEKYPLPLKYFTQYVLLPLIVVYLTILFAYEAKIIIAWSLPKGWVSTMVLAFGVFGVLAFLLLYPLKGVNMWIKRFTTAFYWLLIPLVALLLVAIYVRINTYGITEPRYMVSFLGLWLLGIAFYFIISKKDNIKIIPFSLFIVLIISLVGPLSAFSVSERNQEKLLNRILGLIRAKKSISNDDLNRVHGAVEYLAENHLESFEKYLPEKDLTKIKKDGRWNRNAAIAKALKLPSKKNDVEADGYKNFNVKPEFVKLLKADYSFGFYQKNEEKKIEIDKNTEIITNTENNKITINISGENTVIDLKGFENSSNVVSDSLSSIIKETKNWIIRVDITSGSIKDNLLNDYSGTIYLTKKGH